MNIKMFILSEDLEWKDGTWQKKPNTLIMKPANSLVKQFLQHLKYGFSGVSLGTTVRDTGGTLRALPQFQIYLVAAAGTDTTGIVVGTGTNAVTISDYQLQTKILTGATAGKLNYALMLFPDADVTVDGSTVRYDFNRTFTNSSGGDITIQEVGLYAANNYYFMLDRTLFVKTIANGAGAILTYRIQISV
jgi:hypothetical protein